MKLSVQLSANAGIAIKINGQTIWVDALHHGKVLGFSTVTDSLLPQIWDSQYFSNPDAICVTHCHPDHFSADLIHAALERFPRAKVFAPKEKFDNQVFISGDCFSNKIGDLELSFLKLPHDAEQYADCLHYGMLISVCDKNILIPADCALGSDALAKAVAGKEIDVAFLNFPWITLKKGREFVDAILKPNQTVVYHLPFAEDDINHYRESALQVANSRENTHLLWNPLQTLELEI